MKMLRRLVVLCILTGTVLVLVSAMGLLALNYSPAARNFVVRWKVKSIFENHGHVVVWEKPIHKDALPRHLEVNVKRWERVTDGWILPAGDHSREIGQQLIGSTLVHVREVEEAIPDSSLLTIFLFEEPITTQNKDAHVVDARGREVPIPQHRHHGMWYVQTRATGVWGGLALFPLENYFPFEELRGRRQWVPRTKQSIRLWGGGIAGSCMLLALLGVCFLRREQLTRRFFQAMMQCRQICVQRWNTARNIVRYTRHHVEATIADTAIKTATHDPYQSQREGMRREQAALRAEIETMYQTAQGETADKLRAILGQFPGNERVRLSKATRLFADAQELFEKGASARVSAPLESAGRPKLQAPTSSGVANAESSIPSDGRWLYELLKDMRPYILKEGGDPIIASAIVLSFIQPKQRSSFIGGNYSSFETIRASTEHKSTEAVKLFGRRISPEDFEYNFRLLKKGGVILSLQKTGRGHGKLSYSLNDKERDILEPWDAVIRIINRARSQLLVLHGQGKP